MSAVRANAVGLELGLAAVSGGDDRTSPAALARLDFAASYFLQGLLYGDEFGPVQERTGMLTLGSEATLRGLAQMHPVVGITAIDEYISLFSKSRQLADGTTQPPIRQHNYNFGVLLGVRYEFLAKSRIKCNLGWESHLFPASDAAIFLVFGIKQVWSAALGVDL